MSRPLTDPERLRIAEAARHVESVREVSEATGYAPQTIRRALAAVDPKRLRQLKEIATARRNRLNRERETQRHTRPVEWPMPATAPDVPCRKRTPALWALKTCRETWAANGVTDQPRTEPEARLAICAARGEAGLSAALRLAEAG